MIELAFPAPSHPLSINESNRMHWADRRRRLQPWATATVAAARSTPGFATACANPEPVTIHVSLPFLRKARRDAHNYTGTVVKAIVDALVREGLVPDDTPEWVTVEDPTLVVPCTNVHVRIQPRRCAQ